MKKIILLLMAFATFTATAQVVFEKLKDGVFPAAFYGFHEYNGKLYFSADDNINGRELWVTDGTETGTQMLKDINPNGASEPRYFKEYNGKLYFSAHTGTNGRELWVTDGTETGTQMLKDIRQNGNGDPKYFTEYNGKLYFQAENDSDGYELWVTDGTSLGTQMIKDTNLSGNGNPQYFTEYNGKLYFQADSGDDYAGYELWVTDGTATGTTIVSSLVDQGGVYEPEDFVVMGGWLYFSAASDLDSRELWKTDGTLAGTQIVKNINPTNYQGSYPKNLKLYNNKIYFTADNGTNGRELWVTDGTEAGTQMVIDVLDFTITGQGPVSSNPENFTIYNGELYFSVLGKVLYKTDGTATGTQEVKIINPTTGFSVISNPLSDFTVYGGKLYFKADDNTNGYELWESDGTEAGTIKIAPPVTITVNPLQYEPSFTLFQNELYFAAKFDGPYEVWKITSPTASVDEVKPIKISLYPNPVQDQLHIQTQEEIKQIKLISFTGQLLQTWNTTTILDLSNYAQGIYFVQINTENSSTVEKIIKK